MARSKAQKQHGFIRAEATLTVAAPGIVGLVYISTPSGGREEASIGRPADAREDAVRDGQVLEYH